MNTPLVSVLIPVYNDYQRLACCLDALEKQTYAREDFEIIVIDNASDKDIKDLFQSRYPNIRFFRESKIGAPAAINHGLQRARGKILAFTDADCLPTPDWLKEGVMVMESENNVAGIYPDIVGGMISIFFENDNKKPSAIELHEKIFALNQERHFRNYRFYATASLFVKREVFDLVGDFDEKVFGGYDRELCNRAYVKGVRFDYAPGAIVFHPARRDLKTYFLMTLRHAAGDMQNNYPWIQKDTRTFLDKISDYNERLMFSKTYTANQKIQILVVDAIRSVVLNIEKTRLRLGGKMKGDGGFGRSA